jgi:hypothetical protein
MVHTQKRQKRQGKIQECFEINAFPNFASSFFPLSPLPYVFNYVPCFLLHPCFIQTRGSHTFFFHTLQITLFCSHYVPIKLPRDSHKAQT